MDSFTFKVEIDTAKLAESMTSDEISDLIDVLVDVGCSYEIDMRTFTKAMSAFIATVNDSKADADVKLEIDATIKTWVDEFNSALHGK